MKPLVWIAIFSMCAAAHAQERSGASQKDKAPGITALEGLTPTDVLDFGEITGTFRLTYDGFGASLVSTPLAMDVEVDTSRIAGRLDFAGGLGRGIEAELSIPITFMESTEGRGSVAGTPESFDEEASGLGDLRLTGNYRIFQESKMRPHWMAGLIMVLPIGDDAIAGGGENGGVGEGAFKLGLQSGVSKQFGPAKTYGLAGYVLPLGDHREGGIRIDLSGDFTLTLGSEFAVYKDVVLDTRLVITGIGGEATQEAGVRDTAAAFFNVEFGAQGYIPIGSGFTVVAGARILWSESHAVSKESDVNLEDSFGYGFTIGIHYVFEAIEPPGRRLPAPPRREK